MKFCSQCGRGNEDDAGFCIQCGTTLPPAAEPVKPAGAEPARAPGAVPPPSAGVQPPPPVGAQPPPFMPPPYATIVRPAPTDGMAIAALVLSIASFVFCPLVAAVLGIIFGYMSLKNIQESGGAVTGEPIARAGIIVGWIHIGLLLLITVTVLIIVAVASIN